MRDHHLLRPPRLSTAWLTSAGVTFFMDLPEPSGSVSNALSTGTGDRGHRISWGVFRVGDGHSRQHLPKDLFLFEHTPPFVLAVVATAPETQPG